MLQSVYFEVKNVQDKHDLKQMKKGLDTLYGVLSVSVNQKGHRLRHDRCDRATNSRLFKRQRIYSNRSLRFKSVTKKDKCSKRHLSFLMMRFITIGRTSVYFLF